MGELWLPCVTLCGGSRLKVRRKIPTFVLDHQHRYPKMQAYNVCCVDYAIEYRLENVSYMNKVLVLSDQLARLWERKKSRSKLKR